MVQACWHCGIPLQRSSQYIGIADVILGLLNFIILMVHIREVYGVKAVVELTSSSDSYGSSSSSHSSFGYRTRIANRTFPGLDFFPPELVLTMVVCHATQFLMGIVLYISAVNKNRNACLIWLVVTAFTALFTGLLFRLYEMLIVNEFTHELKQELEVSYFPGQQPIQVQLQHHHHHHHPQMFNPQAVDNQPNYADESHVSVFTVPLPPPPVTPAEAGFTYNTTYSGINGNPPPTSPYFPPITPMNPQQQYQHIPAALQPPPQYDVVVSGGNFAGGAQGGNSSTSHTVESVMFPNDKNGYGKSFSKI